MAIWEFNHLKFDDVMEAVDCLDTLEEIFGESVVDEDFERELRAELSYRLQEENDFFDENDV